MMPYWAMFWAIATGLGLAALVLCVLALFHAVTDPPHD
jgi:hypothetical protein